MLQAKWVIVKEPVDGLGYAVLLPLSLTTGNINAYAGRVAGLATALNQRLRPDISPADKIILLNRYLFDELGFRGNAANYYDPRNSFLNDVLDRRLGIPLTLAILYIAVGRRVGLPLHGVSFPAHFLVKCSLRDGAVSVNAPSASAGWPPMRNRSETTALGSIRLMGPC